MISKPEYTYYKDNQGNLFSYSHHVYTENVEPPYTSLLTDRWDYECNLGTNCRSTLVQLAYDQYGNVISTYEHGDTRISGDERTTVRGYAPNDTDYIVGFPAYETKYEGIGTTGALLQQVLNYYDNQATYDAPPIKGNLTRVYSMVVLPPIPLRSSSTDPATLVLLRKTSNGMPQVLRSCRMMSVRPSPLISIGMILTRSPLKRV